MSVKCAVRCLKCVRLRRAPLLFQLQQGMSRDSGSELGFPSGTGEIKSDVVRVLAEVISMSSCSCYSKPRIKVARHYQLTRQSCWRILTLTGHRMARWPAGSTWALKCQVPAGSSRTRREGWTVHIWCVWPWNGSSLWFLQWSSMDRKLWTDAFHNAVCYPTILPLWKI